METWKAARAELDLCIFGSFETGHREILDVLIEYLQGIGFERAGRVDIPKEKGLTKSEVSAHCRTRAASVPVAIFVLFDGATEPNQSTVAELTTRFNLFTKTTGTPFSPNNTLVIREKGVPVKGVIAGMLEGAGVSLPDPWETQDELNHLARGFLVSCVC